MYWQYYPEADCPYYRCTVFSHYAKKNAPEADTLLPTVRLGDPNLPVPGQELYVCMYVCSYAYYVRVYMCVHMYSMFV